eukprot:11223728-Lingulodinium_polyedra.AAC.1
MSTGELDQAFEGVVASRMVAMDIDPRVLDSKQRTATDCGLPIQWEALPERTLIPWGAVAPAPETQLSWEYLSAKEE